MAQSSLMRFKYKSPVQQKMCRKFGVRTNRSSINGLKGPCCQSKQMPTCAPFQCCQIFIPTPNINMIWEENGAFSKGRVSVGDGGRCNAYGQLQCSYFDDKVWMGHWRDSTKYRWPGHLSAHSDDKSLPKCDGIKLNGHVVYAMDIRTGHIHWSGRRTCCETVVTLIDITYTTTTWQSLFRISSPWLWSQGCMT